jgi:photosystem II stability/assembly factor-like uncharacterized protein
MHPATKGGAAAAALCVFLSACGGGGSSAPPPPPPPPPPPTQLPATISIESQAKAETGATVTFQTSLTVTQGITFRWDFGDGTTSDAIAPTHSYAKTGTFQATVSVANSVQDTRAAAFSVAVGNYSNVAGLSCTGADNAGWCWQATNLTPHAIGDIAFVPLTTQAYAAGAQGALLFSPDGGDTWKLHDSGSTDDLVDVRFRDWQHGIALTATGHVLATADGGLHWQASPVTGMDTAASPQKIAAYDATQLVIADGSRLFVSRDEGATWADLGLPQDPAGSAFVVGTDCWSVTRTVVQAATGCSGTPVLMLPGLNTGASFTFYAGAFSNPNHGIVLALAYDPKTGLTTNQTWVTFGAGSNWSHVDNQLPLDATSPGQLQMTDYTHALWSDAKGGVYASADNGTTWAAVAPPADIAPYIDPAYPTRNHGVIAASQQLWFSSPLALAVTTDYGQHWQEIKAPEAALAGTDTPAVVQWADAKDVIVRSGDRYYVTHDADNVAGPTWQRVLGEDPRDSGTRTSAVWFSDAKHGLLATGNGAVQSTIDGGQTWSRQDFPAQDHTRPVALAFSSATDGWMMRDGSLWHTIDGGTTWREAGLPDGVKGNVAGMSWPDASHGWIGLSSCCNTRLYATTDGGATWTASTPPLGPSAINSVVFEDAGTGVISTSDARLLRTADGGATWTSIGPLANGGIVRHTGAHAFWFVAAGGTSVLRSTDGGATWSSLALPAGVVHDVAGTDDTHVWFFGGSTVFASADGGATWDTRSLPADLAVTSLFDLDEVTLWGVTSTGQVVATATGGR